MTERRSPTFTKASEETSTTRSMQITNKDDVLNYSPSMRAPLITRNPPVKTILVATFLLFGGIFFIAFGLSVFFSNLMKHGQDRGIALLVLGGIMFLPGSYATTVLYGTWMGWEGYDFAQLPSYDDDASTN